MHASRCASTLLRPLLWCSLAAAGSAFVTPALAQDSAFLACARFEDRGQRIACLEDALEAATAATGAATAAAAPATATAAAGTAAPGNDPSLLERIRSFGQDDAATSLSVDESGQERLHDSIATLEKRNNLWTVTLAGGQVWRQTYPRNLLLREGDTIEIYREGIGNAFRLATPRLSGFIRVERVR